MVLLSIVWKVIRPLIEGNNNISTTGGLVKSSERENPCRIRVLEKTLGQWALFIYSEGRAHEFAS